MTIPGLPPGSFLTLVRWTDSTEPVGFLEVVGVEEGRPGQNLPEIWSAAATSRHAALRRSAKAEIAVSGLFEVPMNNSHGV